MVVWEWRRYEGTDSTVEWSEWEVWRWIPLRSWVKFHNRDEVGGGGGVSVRYTCAIYGFGKCLCGKRAAWLHVSRQDRYESWEGRPPDSRMANYSIVDKRDERNGELGNGEKNEMFCKSNACSKEGFLLTYTTNFSITPMLDRPPLHALLWYHSILVSDF